MEVCLVALFLEGVIISEAHSRRRGRGAGVSLPSGSQGSCDWLYE